MKINPDRPFRLVYALYQHQYLGALWEGFVVQLDDRGRYTLCLLYTSPSPRD